MGGPREIKIEINRKQANTILKCQTVKEKLSIKKYIYFQFLGFFLKGFNDQEDQRSKKSILFGLAIYIFVYSSLTEYTGYSDMNILR